MQLFPRQAAASTSNITGIFGALSLAVANYKPVPVLPTSASLATAGGGAAASFAAISGANNYQLASSNGAIQLGNQDHNTSQWGQTSLLYVPKDVADNEADVASSSSASKTSSSGNVMQAIPEVTAYRTANSTGPPPASAPLSSAKSFASSAGTMGPGGCPILQPYTPLGGWAAVPPPVFPAFDPVKANVMRYRQQVGVNLGNWFVAENWMEPSAFTCSTGGQAAEYDLLDGYGQSANGVKNATAKMVQHWDTWINETDFQNMAAAGINTIRLPIGYWSVGPYFTQNSPFNAYQDVYAMSWRFVARAINWAAKYDIGVILDLHGAYGSQNGQAHSGLSDGNVEFYTPFNMNLTTNLLVWIAHEISDVTNVVGIQLLNEPQNRDVLWTWYNSTMDAMRASSPYAATVPLYFHDAFVLGKGAKFVSQRSDFVVQDHHSYYVYTAADVTQSAQSHTQAITSSIETDLEAKSATARRNLIIGEWSCALAPSSLASSSNPTQDQTAFCTAQNQVYANTTAGWTFWSWKLENCDNNAGWCFQSAIKNYLASPFNAWGLPDSTAKTLAAMSTTSKANFNTKVTTAVQNIKLPTLAQSNMVVMPATDSSSGASSFVASASGALSSVSDTPRIGKVTSIPTTGGSLAARAAAISAADKAAQEQAYQAELQHMEQLQDARQLAAASSSANATVASNSTSSTTASSNSFATLSTADRILLASNTGYSDGFLSSKIFAQSTSLSRLGFGVQYMQDSWTARLAQGTLKTSDSSSYSQQFAQGVQDAETAIILAIQSALSSTS